MKLFKFSDDSTFQGLIFGEDESAYRAEVKKLVQWCDQNNLDLNVTKTKEKINDTRTIQSPIAPLLINGKAIEQVDFF